MRNITNEEPSLELKGRLAFSSRFVYDSDIKSKSVLDIGCGYGWFELNALKKGVKNIVGMEMSDRDLSTAKKHIFNPANFLLISMITSSV